MAENNLLIEINAIINKYQHRNFRLCYQNKNPFYNLSYLSKKNRHPKTN